MSIRAFVRCVPIAFLPLALLSFASPAGAQESAGEEVAVSLARVPPGSTLRIQTVAGDVVEGAFRLVLDSVLIEAGTGWRGIVLGDVRSAWVQQRRTRTGAVSGALVGGAAGAAYLGLFALLVGATGSETATMLAVGGLGGAAAGGVLGGVVGAAVPRWTLVYPAGAAGRVAVPAVTDRPDRPAGRRHLGSVEGALGYGRVGADEPTSGGFGGRLALHADFGSEPAPGRTAPFLTVGPEIGWFDLGNTGLLRREYPPADTLELRRRYSATTAGGLVRGGLDVRTWRGYGLLGLSYNRWDIEPYDRRWISQSPDGPVFVPGQERFEHVGYTVGIGAQVRAVPRTAVGLELRRTAVGTFDMDLPGSYWTVTVTALRRW